MGGGRERLPCCVTRKLREHVPRTAAYGSNGNILLAGCNSAELRARARMSTPRFRRRVRPKKYKTSHGVGDITTSTSSRATSSRSTRSNVRGGCTGQWERCSCTKCIKCRVVSKENRPGACHDKDAIEGGILAFCALETRGGGCVGQWERCACSAPSRLNAEWHQKSGHITTRTSSRVTFPPCTHSERAGEGVRDSGKGARAVNQADRMPSGAKKKKSLGVGASRRGRRRRTCGERVRGTVGKSGRITTRTSRVRLPRAKNVRGRVHGTVGKNVRGRVRGQVGKMHARCTKPGKCPVVPKKELTPGTLIIVLLLILLYTRFLGVGGKGGRWCKFRREGSGTGWESGLHPCEAWTVVSNTAANIPFTARLKPVDKATIGHCGKTQRMALAAHGGGLEEGRWWGSRAYRGDVEE
ncbi:hypothetical protein B0H19DRAFT_1074630 [Mycena capillaripes]|nr:hypothetical protein B0H19DRAFT_1074630 [Mycena capillaripes]